jgi:hypothetical protein
MRKFNLILLSAVTAFAFAASAVVYADTVDSHSMMGRGMMGGATMGRMSQMMEHCGSMMGGRSGRPNEQWRNGSSATPEDSK